jgi:hypothetical protein
MEKLKALSCEQIRPDSYSFSATRELTNGVTAGRLDYPNPWLRVEFALRVAPDCFLTLEHAGLGTWTLGGFSAARHYQFRQLEDVELPRRAALFLEWALALRALHF